MSAHRPECPSNLFPRACTCPPCGEGHAHFAAVDLCPCSCHSTAAAPEKAPAPDHEHVWKQRTGSQALSNAECAICGVRREPAPDPVGELERENARLKAEVAGRARKASRLGKLAARFQSRLAKAGTELLESLERERTLKESLERYSGIPDCDGAWTADNALARAKEQGR